MAPKTVSHRRLRRTAKSLSTPWPGPPTGSPSTAPTAPSAGSTCGSRDARRTTTSPTRRRSSPDPFLPGNASGTTKFATKESGEPEHAGSRRRPLGLVLVDADRQRPGADLDLRRTKAPMPTPCSPSTPAQPRRPSPVARNDDGSAAPLRHDVDSEVQLRRRGRHHLPDRGRRQGRQPAAVRPAPSKPRPPTTISPPPKPSPRPASVSASGNNAARPKRGRRARPRRRARRRLRLVLLDAAGSGLRRGLHLPLPRKQPRHPARRLHRQLARQPDPGRRQRRLACRLSGNGQRGDARCGRRHHLPDRRRQQGRQRRNLLDRYRAAARQRRLRRSAKSSARGPVLSGGSTLFATKQSGEPDHAATPAATRSGSRGRRRRAARSTSPPAATARRRPPARRLHRLRGGRADPGRGKRRRWRDGLATNSAKPPTPTARSSSRPLPARPTGSPSTARKARAASASSSESPENDDFAHATELSAACPAYGSVANKLASKEAGEPDHAGRARALASGSPGPRPAPDRSRSRTCTHCGDLDTFSPSTPARSLTSLSAVASDDERAEQEGLYATDSAVEFTAVAGTTYEIAVDGKGDSAGAPS